MINCMILNVEANYLIMKNSYLENIKQEIQRQAEWAIRYLTIYDLTYLRASNIVDKIIREMCQFLSAEDFNNGYQEIFQNKLQREIQSIKNVKTVFGS